MSLPAKAADRFWSKVLRRDRDECWPWDGAISKPGYGVFMVGPGLGTALAHRVAYQLINGDIPSGLQIDHQCHTRARDVCPGGPSCPHRRCCNPAHLEPVTNKVNSSRGNSAWGVNSRRQTCPWGHAYDWIYIRADGRRERRCSRCYGSPYGNYALIEQETSVG